MGSRTVSNISSDRLFVFSEASNGSFAGLLFLGLSVGEKDRKKTKSLQVYQS